MQYGQLTVFTGPMFAGKTEALVKEIIYHSYFAPQEAETLGIFRLEADRRFADDGIVSHDGATVRAETITGSAPIRARFPRLRRAFFDEVQFFTAPFFEGDFLDVVREMRLQGIDVFCAGLDMDYLGRAFEITGALMAEASDIRRLSASCSCCCAPATHTARLDEGFERFELGAGESYAPMCQKHWLDHNRRMDFERGAA